MSREDWLIKKEAAEPLTDLPPAPKPDMPDLPDLPPAEDKPPLLDEKPGPDLPELPQRSLEEARKEHEAAKPPVANPTGVPEETKPMSSKELASIMETSAKALFDAKLTVEKALTALQKVQPAAGPSQMDKEIAMKSKGFADSIKKMGDTIEALAKEVSDYRDELAKPRSPWTE